ncbi:MAG: penicillin-binding protein activator [Bdellovibrionales bacterium]
MFLRWITIIALLLLNSCVTTPKKKPLVQASEAAKKELSQAQIELAAGGEKKALQRFKRLADQHPHTDVADDATIQMARIYYKQQNYDQAYKTYMSLVESDIFSANESEALLGASQCLHKMGRLDESLALSARGLKIPGLPDTQKLEFYRHRYAVLVTTGDRLDALRALAFIYEKDSKADAKASAQARAGEIVSQYLSEDDLEKVVRDDEFGFVRAQAAFRLGTFKLQKKEYDDARALFSKASDWGKGTQFQSQAENYIAQIDSRRRVDDRTIGAVLPLTGKYSPIAYKTLNGLKLGLGIVGSDKSSLRLAVVDSESSPEGAKKAVERLVMEDSAIAVVGSLLSRTAAAVASKTEELGVPSIALSQKAGITETGAFVFRNAITSEMQVKELVRLAMDEMKMTRFAILYPNDYYGVEYANLFWDEVLSRGGTITGAQVYAPSETDFRGAIRRLVGTYYLEDRKSEYKARLKDWYEKQKKVSTRQRAPDDILPPIVDFDGLFIPDSAKAIGQIAPMLAYQDVTHVRMLGTNIWNTSEFVRRGQQNVENAVFVDSTLAKDPDFQNSKFVAEYKKIFGESPGVFESHAYEVGLLLRRLISNGERTRIGLASALSHIQEFQGLSGAMKMNDKRELLRPLKPFVVKNQELVTWSAKLDEDPEDTKEESPEPAAKKKSKSKRSKKTKKSAR